MTTSLILNKEMDHLIGLCLYISQTASRIRLKHLSNVSFSPDYIKSYHHELLSISENVEGSAVLLESLLAIEHKKSISIQMKKPPRYHYNREELIKLRENVTSNLSNQIRNKLKQVIEYENNQTINKLNKKFSTNIRTILT